MWWIGRRAVIKDGVTRQGEESFCHRVERTPSQVRETAGNGQREKERKGTPLQPMVFSRGEAKLTGPREANPFACHPPGSPSVPSSRPPGVSPPHLSLVITVWNYSRVQRDETRGIIRSAHIACVASFVCFDKPRRESWESQKVIISRKVSTFHGRTLM